MSTCECGCGATTKVSTFSCKRDGRTKGKHLRFIHGHNSKGTNNPVYNGGQFYLNKRGYLINSAGKYEHVAVVEAAIGKTLPAKAVVHHVDGNCSNNRRDNLVVCQDQAYHLALHRRQRKVCHLHT